MLFSKLFFVLSLAEPPIRKKIAQMENVLESEQIFKDRCVFMALGINQVTYSDRQFCRSIGLSVSRSVGLCWFCYFRHFQVSQDDEIWQPYQRPDQIKLEIVVFPDLTIWGGGGMGGQLI